MLERVRFHDSTGFEQPAEAFSVLVPRGWTHDGGIVWKSLQACRGEMVSSRWSVSSPDGAIRFESLPIHSWGIASDPMMLQTMQMQAQQGGCGVGQPIGAEQYLRQVMGPRELQGAAITEVRPNELARQDLQRVAEESRAKIMQYQRHAGRFRDRCRHRTPALERRHGGRRAVFSPQCHLDDAKHLHRRDAAGELQQRVRAQLAALPGEPPRGGRGVPGEPEEQLPDQSAWKAAIDSYFVRLRQQQDLQHHVRMQALAEQTAANARAHAQRMAQIQAQGAAGTERHDQRMAAMDESMRSWEAQQSSQDRMHTSFVQAIREVQTWQGSDGKVELSSGYEQAWSRGDAGTYILSNAPTFDPRSTFQDQNWQELKRSSP